MALVFAGLLPHSPLLIPNIGKENTAQFALTLKATEEVAQVLSESDAQTIIVLTSKGPARTSEIGINVSPHLRGDLELFGDLVTQIDFLGNIRLCGRLREHFESSLPVTLVTDEKLDYASTIALHLLGNAAKKTVVPITLGSGLGLSELIDFGAALQEAIIKDGERIALIVSADLSHRSNKKSPLGYSAKAKKFDQKIIDAIENKNLRELSDLTSLADEAACEDMGPLISWFSCLEDFGGEMDLIAYEAPFGVGHATAVFQLGQSSSQ